MGLINAAPMGMGLLTPQGPPSWHPATNDIVEACADASSYCLVSTYMYVYMYFCLFVNPLCENKGNCSKTM